MDPRHTGEMFRHLEKQNEHLMDAYRSMSHELHKLQIFCYREFEIGRQSIGIGKIRGNVIMIEKDSIHISRSGHFFEAMRGYHISSFPRQVHVGVPRPLPRIERVGESSSHSLHLGLGRVGLPVLLGESESSSFAKAGVEREKESCGYELFVLNIGHLVEEEMLMRKFYELMSAQGLAKKNEEESSTVPDDGNSGQSRALIPVTSNEPHGQSSGALILASDNEPNGQSGDLILTSSND